MKTSSEWEITVNRALRMVEVAAHTRNVVKLERAKRGALAMISRASKRRYAPRSIARRRSQARNSRRAR